MNLRYEETVAEIERGVVGFVARRGLVTVKGNDARSFLQGQLSQDLAGLGVGESAESLVLSPRGKLDAYVRVFVVGADEFALEVAPGFAEGLAARLSRFKLRVRVEIASDEREALCLRGPRSTEVAASVVAAMPYPYRWPPYVGVDLVGLDPQTTDWPEVPIGDPAAFELFRIRAGEPQMGTELTEDTIAQETPLTARTVSFTKGCFTGQELVARLDARGANVARHLRGIVVAPGGRHRFAYVGEPIVSDGKVAGTLSSVVWSPIEERSYALGYVARRVVPPARATVVAAAGEDELSATVFELPLLETPPASFAER